jgi:hypothetical protein
MFYIQANSSARPYLKKTLPSKKEKRSGEVAQGVDLEFKPSTTKKLKKQ